MRLVSWANLRALILPILTVAPTLESSQAAAAVEVPLVKDGGVFTIPVRINDVLTLDFILDSGASDVRVPADVALTLLRTGTIHDEDFLPGTSYRMADGSSVKSARFMLKQLEIGGVKVYQVSASIGSVEGPLLLGQSFLSRLSSWSLDNHRQVLAIGDASIGSTESPNQVSPAKGASGLGATQNLGQSERREGLTNAGWSADWGSGIHAQATWEACTFRDLTNEGYLYTLNVDVPVSRVKNSSEAWMASKGRAVTVKGCWYEKDGTYVHAKMKRKKDGKNWEQDLNFGDGSWTELH